MFASAFKSFSSNITSNYSIDAQPSSRSGPWHIFNAQKKTTAKTVSVFVFERQHLDSPASALSRQGSSSIKAAQQEVIERLKNEANALARLRHPSILELAEPVEETRNGGLMFVTEQVLLPLSEVLENLAGNKSRDTTATDTYDLNALEIQKGLLQLGKGLEFLHDSAGLVHANLQPAAVYINAKSDWKLAGFSFTGLAVNSTNASSFSQVYPAHILHHDSRLPPQVQLNLDYTSPDFVLDSNATTASDMFSLGLLIISLYKPFRSPIDSQGSVTAYKRIFSSPSTVPRQANNFFSKDTLPADLLSDLLPKLITRRPENRLTAASFLEAGFFNSILVSTMRFLDNLPGKITSEKLSFLKGFPNVIPQLPKSVLQRKAMPALVDEFKHDELLASLLHCCFLVISAMGDPTSCRDTFIPRLKAVFTTTSANAPISDDKKAALRVVLASMTVLASCCTDTLFRNDILPIYAMALGANTPALIDAALSALPAMLPKLDYSTLKNTLFPLIANVFTHTNSLSIKIRTLEAFHLLCGGSADRNGVVGDGLDGIMVHNQDKSTKAVLDKYVIQEKLVPMMKSIRTKEPDVMMAVLKVLRQVAQVADSEFLAFQVLPILWTFSLGPLLDLAQFQAFMALIKSISNKIEREQIQRLRDMSSAPASTSIKRAQNRTQATPSTENSIEVDFAALVTGKESKPKSTDMLSDWDMSPSATQATSARSQPLPTSSWSAMSMQAQGSRSITPDTSIAGITALQPQTMFNRPMQPVIAHNTNLSSSSASGHSGNGMGGQGRPLTPTTATHYTVAPPPPPKQVVGNIGSSGQKQGLDKYESLI